jgi:hypothetical protein
MNIPEEAISTFRHVADHLEGIDLITAGADGFNKGMVHAYRSCADWIAAELAAEANAEADTHVSGFPFLIDGGGR